jgi:hypothetical protein
LYSAVRVGVCSTRDKSLRFAYVTSLRAEGSQKRALCVPKTLPTSGLRQGATENCCWDRFTVCTVHASFSVTTHTALILNSASNRSGTHRFVPTTVGLPSSRQRIHIQLN